MNKDTVVVSGVGCISLFGNSLNDFWMGITGQTKMSTILTKMDVFFNVPSFR